MSDLYWPQGIIPQSQSWRVLDSTGVFESAMNGATRTVSRPGTRMACSISVTVQGANRHMLLGLLSALKGRANRIWLADYTTKQRGSFPAPELIGNSTFASTTDWTSSNAELVLYADSGRLRKTRTAVTADRYVTTPVTTVSGSTYLLRGGIIAGRGPVSFALKLGTTATGSELVAGANLTSAQYAQVSAAASGTTTYPGVRDYSSGKAADGFAMLDSPSMARCALVNGASQTGSALWIDQLPASTNGLLYAGDMVAIFTTQWEIKRVTADLNANASGQGHLMFEPALRVAPSDNAPIAICAPTARFMLAEAETSWESAPAAGGLVSTLTLDFVEDVT